MWEENEMINSIEAGDIFRGSINGPWNHIKILIILNDKSYIYYSTSSGWRIFELQQLNLRDTNFLMMLKSYDKLN